MNKINNYFKSQLERQHPVFIIFLLFLSFVGTNIYYFLTFDYINELQNSTSFKNPGIQQNMLFSTKMIDVGEKFLSESNPEIEVNDAMVVCNFWRKQAEKDDAWTSRLKANEECVNAILQRLAELDTSKQPD